MIPIEQERDFYKVQFDTLARKFTSLEIERNRLLDEVARLRLINGELHQKIEDLQETDRRMEE